MSKLDTILSINGYGIIKKNNFELINNIKKELTMIPTNNFMNNSSNNNITSFPIYYETENILYIPRYYGLQKYGLPLKNTLNNGLICDNLVFNGILREQQLKPIDNFIKIASDPKKMGGIISVPCGFGKTIMSVYLTCHFKKKTMFVSHKDFLNQQFLDTIKTFVPNARIGKIKQSKVDVIDKDIIIASLQSLAMRDYDDDIFKDIGFVIIDEVHHLGAEVFSKAFKKLNAPIILGLSATLNRKDGMRKVFEYYIGKSVYKHIKNEKIEVNVEMHKYFDSSIDYSTNKLLWNGKVNCPAMINNICSFKPRTLFIISLLKNLLMKDNNRKILILSERRQHLKDFEDFINLEKINNISIGYYVGGLTQIQLDESSSKQIILATYQMASEGMNIPALNTVIFASPISDIQQSIGRILREKPNERVYTPLCIDIWDQFSIFIKKGYSRINFYKKNDYNINYFINNEIIDINPNQDIKYNFINDNDNDSDNDNEIIKNKIINPYKFINDDNDNLDNNKIKFIKSSKFIIDDE